MEMFHHRVIIFWNNTKYCCLVQKAETMKLEQEVTKAEW